MLKKPDPIPILIRTVSSINLYTGRNWITDSYGKLRFFTEKKFICEICGKHLTQMAGLLAHIKYVHSDERPCRCQHCGLGYWLFWSIHLNMDYIFDAIHFNFSDIKPSIYWSRILPPTLALNSSVHNVRKLFAKRLAWKDTWHSMRRRKLSHTHANIVRNRSGEILIWGFAICSQPYLISSFRTF